MSTEKLSSPAALNPAATLSQRLRLLSLYTRDGDPFLLEGEANEVAALEADLARKDEALRGLSAIFTNWGGPANWRQDENGASLSIPESVVEKVEALVASSLSPTPSGQVPEKGGEIDWTKCKDGHNHAGKAGALMCDSAPPADVAAFASPPPASTPGGDALGKAEKELEYASGSAVEGHPVARALALLSQARQDAELVKAQLAESLGDRGRLLVDRDAIRAKLEKAESDLEIYEGAAKEDAEDRASLEACIDAQNEKLASKQAEVAELRNLLWIRHGCTGPYGDDGEMQCGQCLLDFKRMPVAEIRERWSQINLQKLAALSSTPPAPSSPAEAPLTDDEVLHGKRLLAGIQKAIDSACGKPCDHGSPCVLTKGHQPEDRHETEHECIFYDGLVVAPSSPAAPGEEKKGEALDQIIADARTLQGWQRSIDRDGSYEPAKPGEESEETMGCPLCNGDGEVDAQRYDAKATLPATLVGYGIGDGLAVAERWAEGSVDAVLTLAAERDAARTSLAKQAAELREAQKLVDAKDATITAMVKAEQKLGEQMKQLMAENERLRAHAGWRVVKATTQRDAPPQWNVVRHSEPPYQHDEGHDPFSEQSAIARAAELNAALSSPAVAP